MSRGKAKITPLSVWWEMAQQDVQVYLLEAERVGLVDTAAPGADLAEALASAGRAPSDIELVLNTHSHWDHVAFNTSVKSAGGAEICIHQDEKDLVEDPARAFNYFWAPLGGALRPEEVTPVFLSVMGPDAYASVMGPAASVDRSLKDGDVVSAGDSLELQVVHLPGHSPGSVGYFWKEEGTFIAGDAIGGLGRSDGSLPVILDLAAYRRSIDRLLELPIDRLYTTHPFCGLRVPPATVRQGKDVRVFLEDSRDLAERLADALAGKEAPSGARTLTQVADEVVGTLPPVMGIKKVAEQILAEFTLYTVFQGVRSVSGL